MNIRAQLTKLFLFIICVSQVSCSNDNSQIAALDKKIGDLQSQVKNLKASLDQVQADESWDKLLRDAASTAYLTPGARGYSVIKTDLGYLTVQLTNVQAYANGTRVTLRFGNLTSATINGAKATLEWGRVDKQGNPENDKARSKEVKFDEPLRSGAWTEVHVVLEGIPPQEFGFVRVRDMTHSGIILYR